MVGQLIDFQDRMTPNTRRNSYSFTIIEWWAILRSNRRFPPCEPDTKQFCNSVTYAVRFCTVVTPGDKLRPRETRVSHVSVPCDIDSAVAHKTRVRHVPGLETLEFIAGLVVLVPKPTVNMTCFDGSFCLQQAALFRGSDSI